MEDPGKVNGLVQNGTTGSSVYYKSPVGTALDVYEDINMQSAESMRKEKQRIYKNIILISVAFLFNFNAFQGLSRLQSSLHVDEGMGVINSSLLYGALVLSCFFVPKLLINFIGHKWTIPLSFCGYVLWMAANGYPQWGTLAPASVIVGLCAAPLWTAQCAYFTIIGARFAKLTNEDANAVVTRFFGIFFFFFQLSGITGSVISATVLQQDPVNISDEALQFCGVNDCPGDGDGSSNDTDTESGIPDNTLWTMVGIYIGIAVAAILIVIFLVDNLPSVLAPKEKNLGKEILSMVLATAKNLRHKKQLILIPLTMYSGFEQASYNAEFTASFVTCSIGVWNVGLVTIPFGVVNALVSFMSGRIAKYTGRIPIFVAGFIVDLAIQITLMHWMPNPDQSYVLYILAGMWGFTDGIWQTQINALYGVTFSNESEAAFSNYRMWESFGFIIAFAYSTFICTSSKIYILTAFLCAGMLGYFVVEYLNMSGKSAELDLSEKETSMNASYKGNKVNKIDNDIYENEIYENDIYENDSYENISKF